MYRFSDMSCNTKIFLKTAQDNEWWVSIERIWYLERQPNQSPLVLRVVLYIINAQESVHVRNIIYHFFNYYFIVQYFDMLSAIYITYTYISHALYVIVTPYNCCGILIYLDCVLSINHTLLPSACWVRVRNSTMSLFAIFKIGLHPNDKTS